MVTNEQVNELCVMTTKDDAGRHFTEWSEHWEELEAMGLVEVDRPIHDATGIQYSQEYWTIRLTDEGQAVVDAHPELH